MSYKYLTPAWEVDLPCPQKLVLISLADQANDEGECWPSLASLGRRTGMTDRGIRKILRKLEVARHITSSHRSGTSTLYTVHPGGRRTPEHRSSPLPRNPVPPPPEPGSSPPRNPVPVNRKGTEREPTHPPSPLRGAGVPVKAGSQSQFDHFWAAYPRKVGKEAARRMWDRMASKRPPLPDLLMAIERQRAGEQWSKDRGRFIPHPATWLNQGRWEDEVPGPGGVIAPPRVERRCGICNATGSMVETQRGPRCIRHMTD